MNDFSKGDRGATDGPEKDSSSVSERSISIAGETIEPIGESVGEFPLPKQASSPPSTGRSAFFVLHPYFLPCITAAFVSMNAFLMASLLLKEV